MLTESIEKLLQPKLHIAKKKTVTVLAAALLLLPLFTRPTAACIPPCPPCYWWNGSSCEWDCTTGEYCCDGTCCSTGTTCCHGSCCHPEDCETCQGQDCKSECDLETQHCCGGTCIAWEKYCCDGTPCDRPCCTDTDTDYCCPQGETCCDGSCCDPCDCEACQDGSCVDICDPDECRQCDGQGNCPVCGGRPGEHCCEGNCCEEDETCCPDGSCPPLCEEVGTGTLCGSENDTSCRACVGIIGNCSNYYARVYSNQTIYNCSGGCPGECDEQYPSPPCYDEYYCNDWITYTFAECTAMSPTGPVPLECYSGEVPWQCTRCQQGSYRRTLYNLSMICHE